MEITVNGKPEKLEREITALKFLEMKEIGVKGVVFLVNDEIIKKDGLDEYVIKENDKIEVLRFVSGG